MKQCLTILDSELKSILIANGFRTYQDYVTTTQGEIVSESCTSLTRRVSLSETHQKKSGPEPVREELGHSAKQTLGPGEYYLKIYRYDGGHRRLFFRRHPCMNEIHNYHILRDRCEIPVPDVVAYGSRVSRWNLLDCFLMTRRIPHGITLDRFSDERLHGNTAVGQSMRSHLLAESARMLARMHAAGFSHVDLQWRNLVVSDDGSERPPLFMIDSSRGRHHHWSVRKAHGRLRDLSSLYKAARTRLTATEQLRWLLTYLGAGRLNETHRALIRTLYSDRQIKDNGAAP